MEHQSYSLFELNQYIKQVIALNFEVGIWIEAEISQVSRSRNHIYLDLVQKDESNLNIIAFSKATIWARSALMLRKKYGDAFDGIIKEGQSVKFMISVEFHERYGFSLNIQDIDPQYTLGKIVLQREEIILQLKKEKLLEKNSLIPLGPVIQNIAVLSSENAAGYHDFFNSLHDNDFDYFFDITLFTIALQGNQVQQDIKSVLHEINEDGIDYDCIVIIRGGGAKVDLAAFDNIDIARNVANHPTPILTGIGHEIDICVTDVVAHQHFKTPTAVAEYIIQRNRRFEETVYGLFYRLESGSKEYIHRENLMLQRSEELLRFKLHEGLQALDLIGVQSITMANSLIEDNKQRIKNSERFISLMDPENILNRGYSITTLESNGHLITDSKDIQAGTKLTTRIKKGQLSSVTI